MLKFLKDLTSSLNATINCICQLTVLGLHGGREGIESLFRRPIAPGLLLRRLIFGKYLPITH